MLESIGGTFLTIEVDGTLRNPVVVQVVAIWAIFLATATVLAIVMLPRLASVPSKLGITLLLASLGLVYAATPLAQFVIGQILYRVSDPEVGSVGFWGGPPLWPSVLAATVAGLATAVIQTRRLRRDA